ncbi:MAG: hypothetical protein WAV02_24305 [Stellaceae bacterium]
MRRALLFLPLVVIAGLAGGARAQSVTGQTSTGQAPAPVQPAGAAPAAPAPVVQPPAAPAGQVARPAPPPSNWPTLPRMQLERQFAGPFQDTVIQRWRDPGDGTICYLYIPITAEHSPPTASGYVQYGANPIGSISCFPNPTPEEPARTPKRR